MTDNITLLKRLTENKDSELILSGISPEQFHCLNELYFQSYFKSENIAHLYLFATEQEAENFYNQHFYDSDDWEYFPGLGNDIYSSIIPSSSNHFHRFEVLNKITKSEKPPSIVSSINAYQLLLPHREFFEKSSLKLTVSDVITPEELSKILVEIGYQKALSIEEPGTFSNRGEIFDIYPLGGDPIRLYYFDEMIEEIFSISKETLRTNRDNPLESVSIDQTPYSLLVSDYVDNFRNNFPRPSNSNKEAIEYRQEVFKKLRNQQTFDDFPYYTSCFFNECNTLFDYTKNYNTFLFNSFEITEEFESQQIELDESHDFFLENTSQIIKPSPEKIFLKEIKFPEMSVYRVNELDIKINLDQKEDMIPLDIKPFNFNSSKDRQDFLKQLVQTISDYLNIKNYDVSILYQTQASLDEIKHILKTFSENDLISRINFTKFPIDKGFLYDIEKLLFVSEGDFFHRKAKQKKTKSDNFENDLFADQLSTLEIGDYIIHKDHGLGKYLGVQTLELNNSKSDFVTLEYQDQDKVYVPVYRLNLLQKYSTNQVHVTVANLKTQKFENLKKKARASVKKLAFDLLELQAKRKLKESYAFSPPDHEYNEFALAFPYVETTDQASAIESVIQDMQKTTPMDRLVCGDVGFGKTEVAMRAAFIAVLDNKQVCVLVPTTVLGMQHFNSFKTRFADFPVRIEFISRLQSTKKTNEVLDELKEGKIDILIGTHKLLSDKVKFKDLGLIVIDEEQRFGVGHKEKLKLMRESVDTLTLTATPIPRTLQLSFLGIKELSLIKTPPPKRQSIKTYVIKEDKNTLKIAIEKELQRGGQIFIVHNKVQDIEYFTGKIRELVPSAKIIYAHGQLTPRELEKRITDFYNHKYDILISTTIIESGIDIPNANTMIIDRADTYGLSQLHQLRGRIGRSDKKAYAYFMIPNHKKLSDIAAKRLRALQTYADIGSGFSLASSDLEIRGSGDILGPEQSGHLANIGLELYMELLQEAIQNLKGETQKTFIDIEIVSNFDSYIPNHYIQDAGTRLKYYKKLSNKRSIAELEELSEEIVDQFGQQPVEVKALIQILRSRILLQGIGITKLKIQSNTIIIYFDQNFIAENTDIQERIVNFFMQRPKIYKINPDFSINCRFKDKIELEDFSDFAKHIAEQLQIC